MECFFNLVPTTAIQHWHPREIPLKSHENPTKIPLKSAAARSPSTPGVAGQPHAGGFEATPRGHPQPAEVASRVGVCRRAGGEDGVPTTGASQHVAKWEETWGFHKWKIMVYNMKIPFRWMIWGYAHVRKPPNDEQMVVECQLYHLQLALVMLLSYIIYCRGWYLLSFFAIEHQSHSVSSPYITMFFRETWNQTWLMWNVGKTMP